MAPAYDDILHLHGSRGTQQQGDSGTTRLSGGAARAQGHATTAQLLLLCGAVRYTALAAVEGLYRIPVS